MCYAELSLGRFAANTRARCESRLQDFEARRLSLSRREQASGRQQRLWQGYDYGTLNRCTKDADSSIKSLIQDGRDPIPCSSCNLQPFSEVTDVAVGRICHGAALQHGTDVSRSFAREDRRAAPQCRGDTRFAMASHGVASESGASVLGITIMTQSDMISALLDKNRQLKHRVSQLEGDVLPQLIARLTRLERAAGEPASASASASAVAPGGSSSAGSCSSAASSARAASLPLELGARNLELPSPVAAAYFGAASPSPLSDLAASGGSSSASSAGATGKGISAHPAVGAKRGRQVLAAAAADGASSGAAADAGFDCDSGPRFEEGDSDYECSAAAPVAVPRPTKRMRLQGGRSCVPAEYGAAGAAAVAATRAESNVVDGDSERECAASMSNADVGMAQTADASRGAAAASLAAAAPRPGRTAAHAAAAAVRETFDPSRAAMGGGAGSAGADSDRAGDSADSSSSGHSSSSSNSSREEDDDTSSPRSDAGAGADDDGGSGSGRSRRSGRGGRGGIAGSRRPQSAAALGGAARDGEAAAAGGRFTVHASSHACPHCGREFGRKSILAIHIRTHTGERPYACTQCKAAFAQSSHLRTHERVVHAGERPYACNKCQAAFAHSGDLRRHEGGVHAGEKPYACTQCDAAFARSDALRRHERAVHAGERPYACSQCEAAFTQSSHLRTHERAVHAGERPNACS